MARSRILQMGPARSLSRWRGWRWFAASAAVLVPILWLSRAPEEVPLPPPADPSTPAAVPAPVAVTPLAAPAAAAAPPAAGAACPLQAMTLVLDGAAGLTVCLDRSRVQQTGGVRSYLMPAGDAQGWSLRVDTAQRALLAVALQSRDGRRYGCEAPHCGGDALLQEPAGAGAGLIVLRELRLAAEGRAGEARVTARLQMPGDELLPGLACTGPSLTIGVASGAQRRFCGQGSTALEFADDGRHVYRLQDHEGRTLTVAVDPATQRIVSVGWEGRSCAGDACRGASTSSSDPNNPLAERHFHFGRTPLYEGGTTGAAPAVVLDGSLLAPAQ